jgi:hypothetical protein
LHFTKIRGSMQKPAYKVKIGSAILDSTTNQEIISISVDLDINVPSDSFKIALKPGTKASAIKNGDAVVIEIGYEGALNKVLTGAVDTIEPRISEIVVSGLSTISILTGTRMNQVYEKQNAGAIVKDLASRAGIAVKDAEDGLSFPMYVVDDTKDVYMHMNELSRKCGFDLFLTGDGRLVFKKYARQNPKPFKYGRDIIEAEVYEPNPIAACVKVYGESPSSFKGTDTSHWATKKVVEGVAGSGRMTFLIADPVIRDKDTADKVAIALLETIMIPLSGTLKAIGNARVGLGDTIEIKEIPDSRMNGEFEATSVSHIFNKTDGFVSIVGWVKKIKISPAEPALAAPPAMPAPPKPPSPLEEQLESAKGELEDKRLKLQDSVENAEMQLESSLIEINKAQAEQDKAANEMLEAAEEARKASKEASKEMRDKADELKKDLEAKKKEIEDTQSAAKAKFEDYRKDAEAQFVKYGQEVMKLKDEGEKAVDEARGKVAEVRRKVEERRTVLENVTGKLDEIKKEVERKQKELDEVKEKALGKTGAEKEIAEERIKDLESAVNANKEKIEGFEKDIQDKKKEVDNASVEAVKKEEEIEKGIEDRRKEVNEKINEMETKKNEIKKDLEDKEKEFEAKADEARKKLDETTKEFKAQIDEAYKTAEKMEKEAEEKFTEAKKKVEEIKKEIEKKFEEMKKVYNKAREKVMEARKQAGMD